MSAETTPDNAWLVDYIEQGKAGQLAAPAFVTWIVTRACNLKCFYCFANADKRDPDELSTDEALRVIDDLTDSGVFYISFIGGEPLMRKDIFTLIDHATDQGAYAGILTNGMLVRNDTVARLRDAGCQILGVSIDSHDPLVHDAVRGRTGSLLGAKRAVEDAIRADLRCSIRVVITEQSLRALPDLFHWARDVGVEELIILPIFMVGRAAGSPDDRRADVLAKQNFFDALATLRELGAPHGISVPHETLGCVVGIELNAPDASHHHMGHAVGFEKTIGCKVGRFIVAIQPNGEIHSCPFVHSTIGSLRTQSIREIWQHPLLIQNRAADLGCIARSMIHTGRPDVADPTYGRSTEELIAALDAEGIPVSASPGPRRAISIEAVTTPRRPR